MPNRVLTGADPAARAVLEQRAPHELRGGAAMRDDLLECLVHRRGVRLRVDPRDPASSRTFVRRGAEAEVTGRFDTLPPLADVFRVAAAETHDGALWMLLTEANPLDGLVIDVFGWVRAEECLPYLRDPNESNAAPESQSDPATSIHRKCMLVQRATTGAGTVVRRVAVQTEPDPAAPVAQERAFFDILFIYDQVPGGEGPGGEGPGGEGPGGEGPGGSPRPAAGPTPGKPSGDASANGGWLYVGTEASLKSLKRRTPADVLLGWVPAARVLRWDTREAVEFNKTNVASRTAPALIFKTREGLERHLLNVRGRVPTAAELLAMDPPVLWAVEDLGERRPLEFDQARYPVLAGAEVGGGGALRTQGTPIYQVGVIGDVVGAAGEVRITDRKKTRLQREAQSLTAAAGTVEVAFLVDGSFSMHRWRKPLLKAVGAVMNTVAARGALTPPKFSVSFYRSPEGIAADRVWEPGPFVGALAAEDRLDRGAAVGGGQADLFKALRRVDELKFTPGATRIVVVVGDDADQVADANGTVVGRDAAVAAMRSLSAADAGPVGFFALAVGDPGRADGAAFLRQTRSLAEALYQAAARDLAAGGPGGGEPGGDGPGGGGPENAAATAALREQAGAVRADRDPDAVAAAVAARIRLALDEATYKADRLREIAEGVSRPVAGSFAAELLADEAGEPGADGAGADGAGDGVARSGRQVIWERQVLAAAEARFAELLVDGGVQIFEQGWIAEYHPEELPLPSGDPPSCLRHMAFLQKDDLERLKRFIDAVVDVGDFQADKAWEGAVEGYTGEGDVSAKTPAQLIRMQVGVQAKVKLMAMSFEEIGQLFPQEVQDLKLELQEAQLRMADVIQERHADYARQKVGRFELTLEEVPGSARAQSYWFPRQTEGRSEEVDQKAWIPREALP